MEISNTDCRTEEGITVGLVDSIITICRVIKDRDLDLPEVKKALNDLYQDEDFNLFLNKIIKYEQELIFNKTENIKITQEELDEYNKIKKPFIDFLEKKISTQEFREITKPNFLEKEEDETDKRN